VGLTEQNKNLAFVQSSAVRLSSRYSPSPTSTSFGGGSSGDTRRPSNCSESAEIIDERVLDDGTTKELLLVVDWKRPLHIVVVVDDARVPSRLQSEPGVAPSLTSEDALPTRRIEYFRVLG